MTNEALTVKACIACPRQCAVERLPHSPSVGFCRLPSLPSVCRAELHFWEEPDISGTRGSGAVFFSGCVLRCEFCQNYDISRSYCGKPVTPDELCDIFDSLAEKGAHNINLVSPTQYSDAVILALNKRRPTIPVVWNSSGYESVETLKRLEGLVDIYLPDFKYSDAVLAMKYSSAPDYPAVASAAVKEMLRQVGTPVHDNDGIMQKGLAVRHLVLPDNVENSLGVLDILSEILPKKAYISLMAQYFPTGKEKHTELSRPLKKEEYEAVCDYMWLLGLSNGYVQELSSACAAYVPDWNML